MFFSTDEHQRTDEGIAIANQHLDTMMNLARFPEHSRCGGDNTVQSIDDKKDTHEQQNCLSGPLFWRCFWTEVGPVKMLGLSFVPMQKNYHVHA